MTAYEAERRAEFEARFAALLWRAIARDLEAHDMLVEKANGIRLASAYRQHLCAAK